MSRRQRIGLMMMIELSLGMYASLAVGVLWAFILNFVFALVGAVMFLVDDKIENKKE